MLPAAVPLQGKGKFGKGQGLVTVSPRQTRRSRALDSAQSSPVRRRFHRLVGRIQSSHGRRTKPGNSVSRALSERVTGYLPISRRAERGRGSQLAVTRKAYGSMKGIFEMMTGPHQSVPLFF
jgi:hypothetical protein